MRSGVFNVIWPSAKFFPHSFTGHHFVANYALRRLTLFVPVPALLCHAMPGSTWLCVPAHVCVGLAHYAVVWLCMLGPTGARLCLTGSVCLTVI